MNKFILAITIMLAMAGCSGGNGGATKPDTFSKEDLCIVKKDATKSKVCYGESRSDAEKVLGSGKSGGIGGVAYDFGVTVMYRNDSVAGIMLREDSKGVYQTTRGASIGMPKNDVKKAYGEKYELRAGTEANLDYVYDSKINKFLDKATVDALKTPEEMESILMFSALFNDNGNATSLMLLDRRMAVYFQ